MMGARGARSARLLLATVFALSAVIGVFAPDVAFAKQTLGISTPSFDFQVRPGQGGKGTLTVINDGDQPIKVMVYAANQTADPAGKLSYDVPNRDTPNIGASPAMWVRLGLPKTTKSFSNTPYIEMKPGDRVPVGFEFTTPSDATPGDHPVVLFFEMFDFVSNQVGSVSKVSGRLGSKVRIRVAGELQEKLDVSPYSVRGAVVGENIPYSFTVRNSGNVDQRVSAHLLLLDSSEGERQRSNALTETTVYAGTSRQVSGVVVSENPLLGVYSMRLDVQHVRAAAPAGSAAVQDITKERSVWAAPLWLVVGAILIAGGIVAWLVWRGTRKQAPAAAPTAPSAPTTPPPLSP